MGGSPPEGYTFVGASLPSSAISWFRFCYTPSAIEPLKEFGTPNVPKGPQGIQTGSSGASSDNGGSSALFEGSSSSSASAPQDTECADVGAEAYCTFVKNNGQCEDPGFSDSCLMSCELC